MTVLSTRRAAWWAASAVVCGMAADGLLGWPHATAMLIGALLMRDDC